MKKRFLFAALIPLALVMSACGGGGSDNCEDAMDDLTKEIGNPEEVNRFDSDDYHSWSFWYWKRGFERTFTWGKNVDGCETSDYRFSPIT